MTSIVILAIVAFLPPVRNQVINFICSEHSGFCKDTTKEESVEKNAKGQIQKRTEITKHQSGKTLWDWLGLAGTLAVPVLLAYLGYQFQRKDQRRAEEQARTEKARAEEQAKTEKDIANDNLRDAALEAYIDRMSELLLDRNLISSNYDDPVQDVARTRTLTVLRRLKDDGERKAIVFQFLGDAGLLDIGGSTPVIYLRDSDFSGANLKGAYLNRINLSEVNLDRTNLDRAILDGTNLDRATLQGAILTNAKLEDSRMMQANLSGANLQRANLSRAFLMETNLSGANLQGANLNGATLYRTNLNGANLQGANLIAAILADANLEGANLEGANLNFAKDCTPDQIKAAKNWKKAHYGQDFRQKLGLPPEPSKS